MFQPSMVPFGISLENTSNKGGGSCYNLDEILKISEFCRKNKLGIHLDGARIFNALVATNQKAIDYGKAFDSISVCLSKGLGAPIGSILLGNKDFIYESKRIRKFQNHNSAMDVCQNILAPTHHKS